MEPFPATGVVSAAVQRFGGTGLEVFQSRNQFAEGSCPNHSPKSTGVQITVGPSQDLPFLRRYARALTGGQTSGDSYVTATLEAVVADPVRARRRRRLARGRSFICSPRSGARCRSTRTPLPQAPLQPGEQRLGNLMPLPRQAFLLVAPGRIRRA